MPLPGWLARFNRQGTNAVTRSFAGRVRGFGIVLHVGRVSGRMYRTPVNLFRSLDGYVIALTYGRDRDWVKNVTAAGGCELEWRGRVVRVEDPRIVIDARARHVPAGIRSVLRALNVTEFMMLREVPPGAAESAVER